MNIAPQKRAKVLVKSEDPALQKLVGEYQIFFNHLAQAEEIAIGPDIERPKAAPRLVREWGEVFLPLEGLLDVVKEKARLRQEMEQTRKYLEGVLRRLNNEDFLGKAPAEVIEKEKRKAQEFKEKLERLEQNITLLSSN
jgi:valyl-tRNA synthetase